MTLGRKEASNEQKWLRKPHSQPVKGISQELPTPGLKVGPCCPSQKPRVMITSQPVHPPTSPMASHARPNSPPPQDLKASRGSLADRIPKLEPRRRRSEPQNPVPVPETPALPLPPDTSSGWSFGVPTRHILSSSDLTLFLASPTCSLVKAWVFRLSEAVVDAPCSAVKEQDLSPPVKALLAVLDEAHDLVAKSPPNEKAGSRFGNKDFRGFLDLARDRFTHWHHGLGLVDEAAVVEASAYLGQSFGDRDRIDYGSGHELNFIMWLLCLYQVGLLQATDFKPLVLLVFMRYLILMRTIQMTYYLEPAGSHGVWGLDDYQFLPFLFGAAQLLHHPFITPRAIHQELIIEQFADDFMYLGQVAFVNSTKTVRGLRWHSPMLDDISSAKSWSKINGGMRRMFVAEVLGKLPVMQHFLFGSLIPAAPAMSCEPASTADDANHDHSAHTHDGTGWGDCCGIKVPSSIAAAQEMKKKGMGDTLRRIPFD